VRFAWSDEQEELRAAARAFLADHSSPERVRAAMQTEHGFDPAVWKRIGSELGWTAVAIPEAYGGLGLGCVELVALMEEMGRVLLCAPFFSTVGLAANAILLAGSEEQRQALLPGIAAGETSATLALAEAGGRWEADAIEASARREGDEVVLSGTKSFVLDGHTAELLLVAAREPGSRGEDGLSLFHLPGEAVGVARRWLPSLDQTRRLAEVRLSDVRVPAAARLGPEGGAWPLLREALDVALVALAAEQLGGAQRCLDMAVAFARERVQFGRPIGSFQAIKHKCADMLLRVESARSASYHAGWVAAHERAELPAAAAVAKAWCSEAFFHCAAENLQIHGGAGFTWEYDCHLYLKRARASEALLGDAAHHRERLARQMGL